MIKVLSALLVFGFLAPCGFAQTVKTPSDGNNAQLSAILDRLDRQSQQIEALAREVSRLSSALENQGGDPTASATPRQMAPTPRPGNAAPTASPTPAALPADAPAGSQMHVVTKGENLTKIAKNYQVSIEEIMKVNKIQDDRKLQIGQNLVIPPKSGATPSASPAASASPAP